MTATVSPALTTTALRRAAVRATRAPSVHNTQPWRFTLERNELRIHADTGRHLGVLDPRQRQLLISCGCALFNARASLAAQGWETIVRRFPDPADPTLLAAISLYDVPQDALPQWLELDAAIDERRTNRRQFGDEPVPDSLLARLFTAAFIEDTHLTPISRPEHRAALSRLSQLADGLENADPAYRAELRAWTTDDLRRPDGVQASAVPHVDGHSGDEIPIRDFDTHGNGWLPSRTNSTADQCLLLLGSDNDTREAWLRAGEALERILLEITRAGFAASLLTQVTEVARTNQALRQELGIAWHPLVLLRVGRAPRTPATRRRRLVDVLVEVPDLSLTGVPIESGL